MTYYDRYENTWSDDELDELNAQERSWLKIKRASKTNRRANVAPDVLYEDKEGQIWFSKEVDDLSEWERKELGLRMIRPGATV